MTEKMVRLGKLLWTPVAYMSKPANSSIRVELEPRSHAMQEFVEVSVKISSPNH
jgi:hypothetical protein